MAVENATKPAADDQLPRLFCSCGRTNNSSYQEGAVVQKENRNISMEVQNSVLDVFTPVSFTGEDVLLVPHGHLAQER